MQKTITGTAKLPKEIHQRVMERVISNRYGMRGKSKWINEAMNNFFSLPNYPELVDLAEDMEEMTDVISIRIPEDLYIMLEKAVIEVRKNYPGMEGVKSKIIRASLIQRLIRS
ncbi:MAG: hypothetical protein H0W84_08915 [Bacteroidetes bacterium]|nr:hypothetical protein [Bacteroidota bacterium]